MNEINIRAAFVDDSQILAYIMVQSWKAAFAGIIKPRMMEKCTNIEQRERIFRKVLTSKSHDALICELNGSPCGIIVYESDYVPACEIVAVHSIPSSWGTGCGEVMMNAALESIKAKNCTHAFLWVFCDNKRARRFYEKCGFVPDGAEKNSSYGAREMRYVISLEQRN